MRVLATAGSLPPPSGLCRVFMLPKMRNPKIARAQGSRLLRSSVSQSAQPRAEISGWYSDVLRRLPVAVLRPEAATARKTRLKRNPASRPTFQKRRSGAPIGRKDARREFGDRKNQFKRTGNQETSSAAVRTSGARAVDAVFY